MKLEKTDRGFSRGDFKDLYGEECSIQESSLATESAIWLGCNKGSHHFTGVCSARMHLDIPRAEMLIELLEHFVKTGGLEGEIYRREDS